MKKTNKDNIIEAIEELRGEYLKYVFEKNSFYNDI